MSLGVMVVTGPLDYEVEMGRRVRDQVVKALSESFGDVEASPLVYSNRAAEEEAKRLSTRVGALLVVVVSGGTDGMIYNAVKASGKPVLVYTHTRYNALAAVREAVAALRREGLGGRVSVSIGGHGELVERAGPFLRALRALAGLRSSRLGVVGRPEPWILTRRSPESVRERLGVEVVSIDWGEMLETAKRVDEARVKSKVEELASTFGRVEVGYDDLEKAVRLYYAMEELASKYGLSAMAVEARDMLDPELRDWGPYLGVALMSDRGIPSDYEVDVEAVLTKLVIHLISGRPSFMANITVVEDESRRVLFSHCTVPTRMIDVQRSTLLSYFETKRTVAIRGVLREGSRVTFARIGGKDLDEIMVGRGVIVDGDVGRNDLCRTQIMVEVDGDASRLLEEPLGNHTVVVYGDYVRELEAFARMAGMRVVRV